MGNSLNPPSRLRGHFCCREVKKRNISRGYRWKVIQDPTRTDILPGLFSGGLFRMVDLQLDHDEISTWPDGIVFENIDTKECLTFRYGILVSLDDPEDAPSKGKNLP